MRNPRFLKKILLVVENVRPPFHCTPQLNIEPNVCPPQIDNSYINKQPSTLPPQDIAQPQMNNEIPTVASPPVTPTPDAGSNPEEVPVVAPTPVAPEPRRSTRQQKSKKSTVPTYVREKSWIFGQYMTSNDS